MQRTTHIMTCSRRAKSVMVVIILTLFDALAAGNTGTGTPSTISLEILRQRVLVNEARASLLRMEYRVIPEGGSEISRIQGSRRSQRSYTYMEHSYAQDGPRLHSTQSSYSETEQARTRSTVQIVDGEVRKAGRLPDLMEGWITPIDKFNWGSAGPIRAAFRPYLNRLLLSDYLVPEYASVRQGLTAIGGRNAALVEIKHPGQKGQVLRVWIDLERGLPLRMEDHATNGADASSQAPAFEEPTRFYRLPNGGWIPVEGAQTVPIVIEGREVKLRARWIVDVNSISIDTKDIPDSLFDIKFPPGRKS